MLLLPSNLKVRLQQMWSKEETFKEPFLIFVGPDRIHFLLSSFCPGRKSGPYAFAFPQGCTSPQNKHTEMGKRKQNDRNCDKVDIWETWPTDFFMLNSRFCGLNSANSGQEALRQDTLLISANPSYCSSGSLY